MRGGCGHVDMCGGGWLENEQKKLKSNKERKKHTLRMT